MALAAAALLSGLGAALPGPALAIATVQELVGVAAGAPYNMKCSQDGPAWYCSAAATRIHPAWFAKITPGWARRRRSRPR